MKHVKLKMLMVLAVAILIVPFVAEVQAKKSVRLTVRVYDQQKKPLPGATVTVYDQGGVTVLRSGTTNKKGYVKFRCLPINTWVNITVTFGSLRDTMLVYLDNWKETVETFPEPQ